MIPLINIIILSFSFARVWDNFKTLFWGFIIVMFLIGVCISVWKDPPGRGPFH